MRFRRVAGQIADEVLEGSGTVHIAIEVVEGSGTKTCQNLPSCWG